MIHSSIKQVINLCFNPIFLALCLYSFVFTVQADVWEDLSPHEFQENEGVEDYVWKEGENILPAYPKDSDLLEVSGTANFPNYTYLIDGKSLTIGADDVIRYTIVVRSSSGSDNISFEGLRCNQLTMKKYAYGSVDRNGQKKLVARNNLKWKPYRVSGVTGYADSLIKNYFCDHNGSTLKLHQIIQNIKYGKGEVDGLYY